VKGEGGGGGEGGGRPIPIAHVSRVPA
jgi:hypothetical protein